MHHIQEEHKTVENTTPLGLPPLNLLKFIENSKKEIQKDVYQCKGKSHLSIHHRPQQSPPNPPHKTHYVTHHLQKGLQQYCQNVTVDSNVNGCLPNVQHPNIQ